MLIANRRLLVSVALIALLILAKFVPVITTNSLILKKKNLLFVEEYFGIHFIFLGT